MIRGYCIGGGVGLALCCDMRICSDNSKFGVPAAKLGLGYRYEGMKKLVDLVGPSFAKEIFFTARQFTAAEAQTMGLVNRVLPEGELETYVKDYADTIGGNAPLTVNSVKYIVGQTVKEESERNLKKADLVAQCFASNDYNEGRKAFMEKRKPVSPAPEVVPPAAGWPHRPESANPPPGVSPATSEVFHVHRSRALYRRQWLNGEGRKGEDVINPATGKVLAHLPHASNADLDAALEAAQKGFGVWKATSAYDRSKIMRKAADLLRERHDHVSKVQTQEQGKVYPESRAEVLTSADIIDWYAEEGRRTYGRVVPGRQKGVRQLVLQEPVGVVAAFTPWNFPTLTPVRKIAGALAAGCSIIIKASEETPGGCVELVKCFADAGLPAGVLNLVFGVPANVSEHLIPSKIVKKISFTGSIPVGKHLAGLAAKGMKRATMEFGGHSPVVVFDDADPEKAADTIAAFKYRNAGQVCISPTRFYVQEKATTSSSPASPNTPRASRWATAWRRASRSGRSPIRAGSTPWRASSTTPRRVAVRSTGGSRHGNQGYFFQPTVITDVPDDTRS